MRIRAFIAAVAAAPSLASAAEPIHLAPSTPWVVDYAENSCRLARRFGDGKDLTTLGFESEGPGFLDMLIIGKPVQSFEEKVRVNFVPLPSEPMEGAVRETDDKGIPTVLINRVRLLPPEAIAAAEQRDAERRAHPNVRPPAVSLAEQAERTALHHRFAAGTLGIEIRPRHDRIVVLDTGPLGEAIQALDKCSRDSLRDWGVDPEVDAKIVRPVWSPKPSAWFSANDYPRGMLAQRKESVVKVRALVDSTGRVTKCTTVSHFNAPDFDNITCANFMKRAHFEPAELADGTKVPSYYVNNVVFRIAQ